MNGKLYCSLIILWVLAACGSGAKNNAAQGINDISKIDRDELGIDTVVAKESIEYIDSPANGFLADSLQPIRENVKRINSITNWTSVDTRDIESSEGGEVKFFYKDGTMEKVVMRQLGETFQQLAEYYLFNNKLSFVFEKTYRYNRPIYYDSIAMKGNNDTEFFDIKKSIIVENRNYFINSRLAYQLNNEKNFDLSSAEGHLKKEQKRIEEDFEELIELVKEKHAAVP